MKRLIATVMAAGSLFSVIAPAVAHADEDDWRFRHEEAMERRAEWNRLQQERAAAYANPYMSPWQRWQLDRWVRAQWWRFNRHEARERWLHDRAYRHGWNGDRY